MRILVNLGGCCVKEVYMRPNLEIISFEPQKAIATEQPGWGWEEDVFSTPETKGFDGKTTEGGDGYEG